MKHKEKYLHTETREKVIREECDKCGKDIECESLHETNEFTMKWAEGKRYPGASYGQETFLELCTQCRKDLLILLEINGYKLQTRDYDY